MHVRVAVSHGNRFARQDGEACNLAGGEGEDVGEDGRADEAGGAREDEMHCLGCGGGRALELGRRLYERRRRR